MWLFKVNSGLKSTMRRLTIGAVFAVGAVFASGCSEPASFNNTDITGSALSAPFELTNLAGEKVTLTSYQGKVVAMFFGYTHCPDVCPITLSQWAQVKDELGPDGDKLKVLFVSVDQARDTPELLKQFVPQFNPDFDALIGTDAELTPLLKGLRVYSAKVDGDNPNNYLMDHSSSSYVFDQRGQLRLLVRHNSETQPLVQDIKLLIAQGG